MTPSQKSASGSLRVQLAQGRICVSNALTSMLDAHRASKTPRTDFAYACAGAIVCFFLASVLLSGWPEGLKPNISHPYIYAGDGLFQLWLIQRVMEGSVFTNPRSGAPFGSPSFDFPNSDSGNLLVSKILGELSGTPYAAFNLYILLGFAVTFAVAFLVFRRMGVRRSIAVAGAVLFAFLPYHFARFLYGHTFYTWYWVVPAYFYAGYSAFVSPEMSVRRIATYCAALIVAACFGVYYALFGVITLMICGIAGWTRASNPRSFLVAGAMAISVCAGVLANLAPSLLYAHENGRNPEPAQRSPVETEVYSLKITHLLMPHQYHRVGSLAESARNYSASFPLSNTVSYVGLAGLVGLVLLGSALVQALCGRTVDHRLGILAVLTAASLLITTVGGLNVFFALHVSPMIRGWDRFSIFIAFYAITAAAVWVTMRWPVGRRAMFAAAGLAAAVCIGVADQTSSSQFYKSVSNRETFRQDQALVEQMEAMFPAGALIYQLPHSDFPGGPTLHWMGVYDPLAGVINSRSLRWSAGGMRGREADRFYSDLQAKPLSQQIQQVKALGFSGIYVLRNGYSDHGEALVRELTQLTGRPPVLERQDGAVSVFSLN